MLQIQGLTKYFNSDPVLIDLNLEVRHGEFVAFVGPNGCGKTTLLHIIADVLPCDGGSLSWDRKPREGINIGFVFQDYRTSLFPWFTVKENIAFPLRARGIKRYTRDVRVRELCDHYQCNLPLGAYPHHLSGGEQQLAALLRGLIVEPDLYILDEPFSSLDYQTSLRMIDTLGSLWYQSGITTLFVSHDIDAAIFLSQRIVVLSSKPAKILNIFPIPFSYPRNISLLGSPEFTRLKQDILTLYRREVLGATS